MKSRNFLSGSNWRKITDPRNVVLCVFVLIVLAITWSGVKSVQTNYDLQKQISALQQQNDVLSLQNGNTKLQNQYYQTNDYLELAARQDFGLAAPGEKILLVPHSVAMKYIDSSLDVQMVGAPKTDTRPKYVKNLQAWRDFLLGRQVTSD